MCKQEDEVSESTEAGFDGGLKTKPLDESDWRFSGTGVEEIVARFSEMGLGLELELALVELRVVVGKLSNAELGVAMGKPSALKLKEVVGVFMAVETRDKGKFSGLDLKEVVVDKLPEVDPELQVATLTDTEVMEFEGTLIGSVQLVREE